MRLYRRVPMPSSAAVNFVGVPTSQWGKAAKPTAGFRSVAPDAELEAGLAIVGALEERDRARADITELDRVSELGPVQVAARLEEAEAIFENAVARLGSVAFGTPSPPDDTLALLEDLERYFRGNPGVAPVEFHGRLRAQIGARK